MDPLISVIIPARNPNPPIFRQLMNSLLAQTYPNVEIIFVDSSDSPPDVIKEYLNRLIYVKQRRKNVSGVRQDGLEAANGGIVMGIDCDCIPPQNWVETMIRKLDRNKAHTIVMGKSVPYTNDKISSIFQENFERWVEYIGINIDGEKLLITLDTKNYAIFTDVALKIGFDTDMSAAEDTDFAFRALAEGNRIVYCPEAPVHHCHRQNLKDLLRQQQWHGFGYGQFVYKDGVDYYMHRPMYILSVSLLAVLFFPVSLALLCVSLFREGPISFRRKIIERFVQFSFCLGMARGIYRKGGRKAIWERIKSDIMGISSKFHVKIIQ